MQLTREALSNVGRHAKATTCRVSLRRGADGLAVLEIDDDGVGFDPEVPARRDGSGEPARPGRGARRRPLDSRAPAARARRCAPPPSALTAVTPVGLLHDQRRHHPEHALRPLDVGKDVAVERPRAGVDRVHRARRTAVRARSPACRPCTAARSGNPSCATTSKWYPCRCIGCSIEPSFAMWISTQSPCLATIGVVAGNDLPLST